MKERIEKIKTHISENKGVYISGALLVVTNVMWYVIASNSGDDNTITFGNGAKDVDITTIGTQNNYGTVERLSYIVTDGERWWKTQGEAAKALGEDPSDVSRHINHGQELRSGANLERVGVRS